MPFHVTHRSEYTYDTEVSSSHGQMHLLPRDMPGQVCRSTTVRIDPEPAVYRERVDYYGNRVANFHIVQPHQRLTITTASVVDVGGRAAAPLVADRSWEEVVQLLRTDLDEDVLNARQFVLDSPLVTRSPELRAYGAGSFEPGAPIVDALVDLQGRVQREFAYMPGTTSVTTPLPEVLELRRGVCQDFAHLMVGCLRSLGLAARYVSGYLETDPPPGQPRLQGGDESHAWASAFVPDAGWIDLDPTNDQIVNDRYVTTAWGRDYTDVPPIKGVIFSNGSARDLDVKVDVVSIDEPG